MTVLVDTSVLVRRTEVTSPLHADAVTAMRQLRASGETLCIIPQNIIEWWAVATRPVSSNGLGLTIGEAEAERLRIETLFMLLNDPPGLYTRWVSLVNSFSVHGKPTHDARIAAAAIEHGITKILTFNVDDFQRFSSAGITAISPRTL